MIDPTPERLQTLPKWAQRYICQLGDRVQRAEATIPWTEPGMEWFTLLKDSEETTIFLCDSGGTHPIALVGRGDRVFVGRAANKQLSPSESVPINL